VKRASSISHRQQDEKAALNDAKPVLSAPGKDTVSIVDIGLPACLIAVLEGGGMP
jgi:hypothetical protein